MLHLTIVLLTVLEVAVALILIALVLAQKSKSGGGLGGLTGGGGGAEEVFGSQTTNILTKATIYFAVFFFVNTLGLAVLHRHYLRGQNMSVAEQSLTAKPIEKPAITEPAPGEASGSAETTTEAKPAETTSGSTETTNEAKPTETTAGSTETTTEAKPTETTTGSTETTTEAKPDTASGTTEVKPTAPDEAPPAPTN